MLLRYSLSQYLRNAAPAALLTALLIMSPASRADSAPPSAFNLDALNLAGSTRPAIVLDHVAIRVNEIEEWHPEFTLFVLAGQTLQLSARDPEGRAQMWEGDGTFLPARSPKGALRSAPVQGQEPLTWKAPDKDGPARLTLKSADPNLGWVETASLNMIVMLPASELKRGAINGYMIGRYPAPKPESPVPYFAPPGFARIPTAGSHIPVSPRFALEEFACKQKHSGDRYIFLEQELLPFLEAILDRVEDEGFTAGLISMDAGPGFMAPTTGLTRTEGTRRPIQILSGYRTPAYNRSLGNVKLSRHMYGDAADIYIDCDGDGSMDDLNRDGRIDGEDAITLARWIEDVWTQPRFEERPGGLGIYNGTGSHGPFVHVDLRGSRARWGGNGLKWDDDESDSESDN